MLIFALVLGFQAAPLPHPTDAEAAAMADAAAGIPAGETPEVMQRRASCAMLVAWADSQPRLRDAAAKDLGSAEQYLAMAREMPHPLAADGRAWRDVALTLAASLRDSRQEQLESDQFTMETLAPAVRQACG